jgi:hypothetical protein
VIDAVDYDPPPRTLDAKDDPMGEVNQMTDFKAKLALLRNYGTTIWQVLERMDRLNDPSEPSVRGFGFLSHVTDESNVVFDIG